jgi:hypothetical protein
MTPIWAMISAVGAAGTVLVALIVHVIGYAYQRGQIDNRLAVLERDHANTGATQQLLSALAATVEALKGSVDRLDAAIVEINGRLIRH